MRKTLLDLYYGNIRPSEYSVKQDSELAEASRIAYKNYEKLRDMQGQAGKERLENYAEAESDAVELRCQEYFVAGMRLGFRLALELMNEGDEMLVPTERYCHGCI